LTGHGPRREAYACTGYSPFLAFTVGELQETVQRLLRLGATLDGPIRHLPDGKARAALRTGVHSAVVRQCSALFQVGALLLDSKVPACCACAGV